MQYKNQFILLHFHDNKYGDDITSFSIFCDHYVADKRSLKKLTYSFTYKSLFWTRFILYTFIINYSVFLNATFKNTHTKEFHLIYVLLCEISNIFNKISTF